MRLAIVLVATLGVLLAARAIVVSRINADRLTAADVSGLAFTGRYYPVKDLCAAVSLDRLQEEVDGNPQLDGVELTRPAPGGGGSVDVEADEGHVESTCKVTDRPRDWTMSYVFGAAVYLPGVPRPHCRSEPDVERQEVRIGSYSACRMVILTNGSVVYSIDHDNAQVWCNMFSLDVQTTARHEPVVRAYLAELFDALADSRPVSYVGRGFWTGR